MGILLLYLILLKNLLNKYFFLDPMKTSQFSQFCIYYGPDYKYIVARIRQLKLKDGCESLTFHIQYL